MIQPPPPIWRNRTSDEAVQVLVEMIRPLFQPDQVIELRVLGVQRGSGRPHTESGFFDTDHLQELARAAWKITPYARGVYVTLNPLQPDLLTRRTYRLDWAGSGELASDRDVLQRRWLLIDADPVRDPHISASEAEKLHAYTTTLAVREELRRQGWPDPMLADSGNGYHLFYPIDLPTQDDGQVERILKSLAGQFDTEQVKIDQKVFNPSRIVKLPGTLARKGDPSETRPHRWAYILERPDE